MGENYFRIFVDDNCIAEYIPLQYALMLIKAIYNEFYKEPGLAVTIKKM